MPEEIKKLPLFESRKAIIELKDKLNKLDEEKEAWFGKKQQLSQQINKLIQEIKEARSQRNELTSSVKQGKQKRDELNEKIKQKILDAKTANKEKEEILKKLKIKTDPSRIKEQINILELKIETEAVSFEAEKRLMKKINELNKKYKEAGEATKAWEKCRELSKEIDASKEEAERTHQQIQEKAKKSQELHEKMIAASKQVDELKPKEQEAYEKFLQFKKEFSEVNEQLKQKLIEVGKIREVIEQKKAESKKAKERKNQMILEEKERVIGEKLKRGKKLTTEDLLVFQKQAMYEKE